MLKGIEDNRLFSVEVPFVIKTFTPIQKEKNTLDIYHLFTQTQGPFAPLNIEGVKEIFVHNPESDNVPVRWGTHISYYLTHLAVLSSGKSLHLNCLRPYHLEYTSSRLITEAKQG